MTMQLSRKVTLSLLSQYGFMQVWPSDKECEIENYFYFSIKTYYMLWYLKEMSQ